MGLQTELQLLTLIKNDPSVTFICLIPIINRKLRIFKVILQCQELAEFFCKWFLSWLLYNFKELYFFLNFCCNVRPNLKFKSWMDPNLHLHSCYRKCTMDYRHLWSSNNPCNISFSFWPSNPRCLPRIWTFGFDIFWPFYLWSIWWWLPIRPELHELQPIINNLVNKNNISYQHYQQSRQRKQPNS